MRRGAVDNHDEHRRNRHRQERGGRLFDMRPELQADRQYEKDKLSADHDEPVACVVAIPEAERIAVMPSSGRFTLTERGGEPAFARALKKLLAQQKEENTDALKAYAKCARAETSRARAEARRAETRARKAEERTLELQREIDRLHLQLKEAAERQLRKQYTGALEDAAGELARRQALLRDVEEELSRARIALARVEEETERRAVDLQIMMRSDQFSALHAPAGSASRLGAEAAQRSAADCLDKAAIQQLLNQQKAKNGARRALRAYSRVCKGRITRGEAEILLRLYALESRGSGRHDVAVILATSAAARARHSQEENVSKLRAVAGDDPTMRAVE